MFAFVGVILTLQTAVVGFIISVPRTALAGLTFALLTLSAYALVRAAMRAFAVLRVRGYRGPSLQRTFRNLVESLRCYKEKAERWTRWRAFAQVRRGSNIQLLPFS